MTLSQEQIEKVTTDFQEWVETGMWEGDDEYTKNFAVGNVSDYWIKVLNHLLEEQKREIQGKTVAWCQKEMYQALGEVCQYENNRVNKEDLKVWIDSLSTNQSNK